MQLTPTVWRRILVAFLLAACLGLTLTSSLTPYLQTCTDQIARVGKVPIVRSCDPMSITSVPVLIPLIAALILLLPDISSFELLGILRIAGKLDEQGRRQDEILRLLQNIDLKQTQSLSLVIHNAEQKADLVNNPHLTQAEEGEV